jgi:short-subunit dehydrogenase
MRRIVPVLMLAGAGFALARYFRSEPADLRGQVALITGGSRGLGLALAREFGQHGCRLALCARNAAELEAAGQSLRADGYECFVIPCDVSDSSQVEHAVSAVRSHYGQIDILVNNAGEMLVAPVENTTMDDFERALAVMFWGVLYPTFSVLPDMLRRGSGRIATITSIGGKISVPHMLPYSCAKSAAVAFCEGLRAEVARHGVSVTTIAPGLMRTGSHMQAKFKGQHEAEATWFSLAATMPGISMSAERAAIETVEAIRSGRAERILSKQADFAARLHGLFPELLPNLMSIVNRLLPNPTSDRETARKGSDIETGPVLESLTALGRTAGMRLNQAESFR